MIALFAAAALAVFLLAIPVLRHRPAVALVIFLYAGFLIPYWVGIDAAGQFVPLILVLSIWTCGVVARSGFRPSAVDIALGALSMLTATLLLVGEARASHALPVLGAWLLPYLIGRYTAMSVDKSKIATIIATLAVVLASQSVLEFVLDWHPFETFLSSTGPAAQWSPIQYRSTFARSEGALGHSISMGAAIAIGAPFLIASAMKSHWKWLSIAVMSAGVAATFSRSALLAIAASIVLVVALSSAPAIHGVRRILVLGAIGLTGFTLIPLWFHFIDGGTGDLANSTSYRQNYLSLIPEVRIVGLSSSYVEYASGSWGWQSDIYEGNVVVTLDNTLMLTALQFGWISFGLLVLIMVSVAVLLMKCRDSSALLAAVSQYATLATVAMITQYPYLFWFVLGVGVTQFQNWKISDSGGNFEHPRVSPPLQCGAAYVRRTRGRGEPVGRTACR